MQDWKNENVKQILSGSAGVVIGSCIAGPLGGLAGAWIATTLTKRDLPDVQSVETRVSPAVVELVNANQTKLSREHRMLLINNGYKLIISEGKHKWVPA